MASSYFGGGFARKVCVTEKIHSAKLDCTIHLLSLEVGSTILSNFLLMVLKRTVNLQATELNQIGRN